jgi:hypothetical protein
MIKVEFVGLTKSKAMRRALDFWYRKMFSVFTLEEFIKKCTWKKKGIDYVVIYRGVMPPEK